MHGYGRQIPQWCVGFHYKRRRRRRRGRRPARRLRRPWASLSLPVLLGVADQLRATLARLLFELVRALDPGALAENRVLRGSGSVAGPSTRRIGCEEGRARKSSSCQ
eukprot:COSAG01_NODE_3945_length_5507_cov_8.483173_1_plen_107_part_10